MNNADIKKQIEFIIWLIEEDHDTKTALKYLKYLEKNIKTGEEL
ncbi:MAG: hypothetical protein WC957_02305 [Candidatus Neomarinimicrobiota bacterium]|jgi:hypothetical protein